MVLGWELLLSSKWGGLGFPLASGEGEEESVGVRGAGPVSSVGLVLASQESPGFASCLADLGVCFISAVPPWLGQTQQRAALPEAGAELGRLAMGRRAGALAPRDERVAAICGCCAACGSSARSAVC